MGLMKFVILLKTNTHTHTFMYFIISTCYPSVPFVSLHVILYFITLRLFGVQKHVGYHQGGRYTQ